VNLSEPRETALYESVYADVLTQVCSATCSPFKLIFFVYLNNPQHVNLHDLVLRVHHDRLAAMPSEHAALFPYFEGYCGSPISAFALSQQQRGAVHNVVGSHCHRVLAANLRQPRITHYLCRQPAPLIDELTSLSLTEQQVLHSLVDGKGITEYEHIGLLEFCRGCQRMFAASALRAHILTCSQN
ncbi:hypothetical protein P692DRAFT_20714881, partial [Suillus brevipes Sb2]